MVYTQEALPYALNALAPHISEETLSFHYGKHHAGYVKKLNLWLEKNPSLASAPPSLNDLLNKKTITENKPTFENAAQTWNHTFYWKSMAPTANVQARTVPASIEAGLTKSFGSVQAFTEKFSATAAGHFGSGWVWLVANKSNGALEILETHDAYNPLVENAVVPLLVIDVWEHAYYIDKRNDRAAYISEWFKVINWEFAAQNLQASKL